MKMRWMWMWIWAGLWACDDGDGGDADQGIAGEGGGGGAGGGELVCGADTPVCDPGCGADEACVFADGACGCQAVCDSTAPACAGDGPNAGCGAEELCNTSCECEPRGCQPDAPVCPGDGPNDGCGADAVCTANCACEPAPPPPPENLLRRPSRSTAVDISTDDRLVAMVNSDDDSLSIFGVDAPGMERRIGIVNTSAQREAEPLAVVIHPDRTRAFVANRRAGTVALINNLGDSPALGGEVAVNGEPVGLALTPSGSQLWVTDWVAGEVVVIDTATFEVVRTLAVGGNPYAIAITHDGDDDDTDEKALITQFYGRRTGAEGSDTGKEGVVQVIAMGADTVEREITLAPLDDCFVGGDLATGCYPNQLYAITVHTAFGQTRAYVTSVAAAPQGPVVFNHNMQAVVSVIDVDAGTEIPALTVNLNSLIKLQEDADGDELRGRRFMNVPNAIAFVERADAAIGYVSSAGSDIVLRLVYAENGDVSVGAASAFNIPVGQNPQGLVLKHGGPSADAFTSNRVGRDLSVISFRDQRQLSTVESTARPTEGSAEFEVWKGQRFFHTSTGRWSKEGWGSCAACHPMGLSDNVTWAFAAGPRQSISMDGQFASDDPGDMRALNWTAVFDEPHDFELNTRGVSGGLGALVDAANARLVSPEGPPFIALPMDGDRIENHQALNGSLRFVANNPDVCTGGSCADWDQIEAYIQTLKSPRGKQADDAQLARGRGLFEEGGCTKCHAGPKWTISRTFYDPEDFREEDGARIFAAIDAASTEMNPDSLVGLPQGVNQDVTLIAGDDSDGGAPALKRQACNLRNVGTFEAVGGAPETRANGQPAQGRRGFNVPSLLGLSLGAPYFHNGGPADLDALLTDFDAHTQAGNPNFLPTAEQRADLIAFLLSIDEDTTPFPIEAGTVLCPDSFP